MKTKRRSRFLHGLLALALAITIMATAVATFALQTISPPDAISWHIDFDNMSSPSDSHIDGVTLQASGFTLTETDSHTCLGRVNGSGFFYVRDDNCAFSNFETVSVEASIRFEAFPSGSSGGNTPATYPMSLITWMTNTASGSTSYRSIRIDDNGRLYTGTSASTATEVVLTPNEWNKVKLVFEPSSGAYSVYVDGIYGFSGNFGAPATLTSSVIRFFDSRYSYTVSLDDIHIRAN